MDFLDFIQRSNECASREQLIKVFETALREYGVNGFIYSLFLGSLASTDNILHGVARSYSEDWMKHYAEKNYLQHDPTYRYIGHKSGAVTWKDLQKTQEFSKKEKREMDEAEEAGLKNGVALAIHGPSGQTAGFGFVSGQRLYKNELGILYALANQFHLAYKSFNKTSDTLPPVTLSDRQKEVLEWSSIGKSYGEIANIMKISNATVDDHFRQIYKKLDSNDKMSAFVKAVKLGLIRI
ncbi:MAG: LuxR family transcriptional regulator [Alphaproteobacteria bacterium]